MTKFSQKGNVSDKDFMIHILNNLLEEYDVIFNGLENHLIATGENALTIDSIHEKPNHRYEKIKSKKEEKNKKEKALNIYNRQYKQRCWQCGKIGGVPKVKMKKKKVKSNIKTESLKEYATTVDRKGI